MPEVNGVNGVIVEPHWVADLSGDQEVPPVTTLGTGMASFRQVSANRLAYTLSVQDLRDVTAAHVHRGRRGERGPAVARLFGPTRGTNVSGFLATGSIQRDDLMGPLKGRRIRDLVRLMRAGRTYTSVSTVRFPEGEIRGQIRPTRRAQARIPDVNAWREGAWTFSDQTTPV